MVNRALQQQYARSAHTFYLLQLASDGRICVDQRTHPSMKLFSPPGALLRGILLAASEGIN